MQESFEDLFSLTPHVDAILIPTNGIVKNSGVAVMGAGVAKRCAELWPQTPSILGQCLLMGGNVPYQLGWVNTIGEFISTVEVDSKITHICRIYSFPTKNHFKDKSDLDLIRLSCQQMITHANALKLEFVALPRVGSGLGGLNWEREVKPAISRILDDRFTVVSPKGN